MSWLKKTIKGQTAVALGGGGIRGVAHLGVLKFLEENNYEYDFMVGTSAGAIFGALYLLNSDVKQSYDKLLQVLENINSEKKLLKITKKKSNFLVNLKEKIFLAKSLISVSLLGEDQLRQFITNLIGKDKKFSDLKKKFYITATDLVTGNDIIFHKGDLLTALMASAALPGIFPPVKYKDHYLIDGGRTQKLPGQISYMLGANRVLGIDVSSYFSHKNRFSNTSQIIIRSEEIVSRILHNQNRLAIDLVLRPAVGEIKWYEFQLHAQAFSAGYEEAIKKTRQIKNFFQPIHLKRKVKTSPVNKTFIID